MSLADIRRDYCNNQSDLSELGEDPFQIFELWLQNAIDAGIPDPTAMTVATVDSSGQPSQRIVLLKDVSTDGFVFYTNLESRKAQELSHNNKISLHFPWHYMERQVKICGVAEKVGIAEATKYFLSRPKGSQLAAWASAQSRPVSSRQMLLQKLEETKQRFSKGDLTLPKFWGGYRVKAHEIEFWQGGADRLHNRICFNLVDGNWQKQRLMP
ncbi:pyridoxamine 5'-phosphate oxidase [Planctobacterium marinum]|uniref:pyridoxamine 5'-phosphate oxidase n=1 Tax=Planctobacterium marinum TaxID=1631968 RepID=UPI001E5195D2|nr:pyridoxamine 5'-phosphate oxidase [Planctobacterium marinum]MCC2604748.1 pyridoxamine 5'-phosphate oxidase [Planctobacterium marinum]